MILHLTLCTLLALSLTVRASDAISIWTAGTVGENHRVKISLTPDSRNRWLCLYVQQVQGGGEEKTHCWEVQGEKEAKTAWRNVFDLTSGKWLIRAAVLRNDRKSELSNEITIHVLGPNYITESEP